MMTANDGKNVALIMEGGCYSGGLEVGHYINANPDTLYTFNYVPVEVRSMYDPYTVWANSGYNLG
jgi:hypothetical protein